MATPSSETVTYDADKLGALHRPAFTGHTTASGKTVRLAVAKTAGHPHKNLGKWLHPKKPTLADAVSALVQPKALRGAGKVR